MAGTDRRGGYAERARTYDLTRGASPSVVRAVSKRLGPADGRSLLDIGGGTGNYAQVFAARGFRTVILDAEIGMVRRSVPKVGPGRQVVGNAEALPFRDRSFSCAVAILVLHLLPGPAEALSEARRVVREGPLVVVGATAENCGHLFVADYFPGARLPEEDTPSRGDLELWLREAGLARVEWEKLVYLDTADGSLGALHTDPYRLAGPAYLRNTSFFQRLPEDVRREGLARLEADLRSGALQEKVRASFEQATKEGHLTVFAGWP